MLHSIDGFKNIYTQSYWYKVGIIESKQGLLWIFYKNYVDFYQEHLYTRKH